MFLKQQIQISLAADDLPPARIRVKGWDIFGTVFQNTRVIWLLYKRWQNLIHKSMLRIHF